MTSSTVQFSQTQPEFLMNFTQKNQEFGEFCLLYNIYQNIDNLPAKDRIERCKAFGFTKYNFYSNITSEYKSLLYQIQNQLKIPTNDFLKFDWNGLQPADFKKINRCLLYGFTDYICYYLGREIGFYSFNYKFMAKPKYFEDLYVDFFEQRKLEGENLYVLCNISKENNFEAQVWFPITKEDIKAVKSSLFSKLEDTIQNQNFPCLKEVYDLSSAELLELRKSDWILEKLFVQLEAYYCIDEINFKLICYFKKDSEEEKKISQKSAQDQIKTFLKSIKTNLKGFNFEIELEIGCRAVITDGLGIKTLLLHGEFLTMYVRNFPRMGTDWTNYRNGYLELFLQNKSLFEKYNKQIYFHPLNNLTNLNTELKTATFKMQFLDPSTAKNISECVQRLIRAASENPKYTQSVSEARVSKRDETNFLDVNKRNAVLELFWSYAKIIGNGSITCRNATDYTKVKKKLDELVSSGELKKPCIENPQRKRFIVTAISQNQDEEYFYRKLGAHSHALSDDSLLGVIFFYKIEFNSTN